MKSLWNDAEAARHSGPLGPRVYSSRLLGRDKSLVLHGGGNTSVKLREKDLFGAEREVLYVKGSGWDLESIEAAGFTPVDLAYVRRLAGLPTLSDPQMVNELNTHMLRAGAPAPSVETLLHAVLPHAYVDHTHADAVLSISNAPGGEERIRALYGERVVVVPYVMPGFDLAAYCARVFREQAGPRTIGMVLLSHGMFSFGADARESYERMVALVSLAEEYLAQQGAWAVRLPAARPVSVARETLAALRAAVSQRAGRPMVLRHNATTKFLAFAQHPEVARLSQQGPATPDHVIRTKPVPMLGTDVAAFGQRYAAYFERHAAQAKEAKTMLDTAPRMLLAADIGFIAIGRSAQDAAIVEDLYDHTIDVIMRAEALGGWRAVEERDLFEIEYWDLEQAKLRRAGAAPAFLGEVVLITGAASGIGKACVDAFLRRGAAVIALDRSAPVAQSAARPELLALQCDVTHPAAVRQALDAGIGRFGGLDMLVLNAGVFPPTQPVREVSEDAWQAAMTVNVEANLRLLQESYPLLKRAPRRGRVVIVGSRNVPAPGPGAAAYSASKAALNQLARVTALEWARDGIRINSLHPDAVYDTGLWTEQLLASRAQAYGMSVAQYRRRNLLATEVSSSDVAELAAEMCGELFAKTTGAQVPVDGGNERVV
jgi:rhamnose utilization protein RhaD (predicted bifunctional aldolase and dehydrogenase)/NAD(P)-dependent dehydrogenase (short-subunit alcohol dehydrogenase family)